MQCLKSFSFTSSANENAVSPEINGWQIGTQHFWIYASTNPDSIFNIQGFKNVNIHKIEMVGDVFSNFAIPNTSALVQDFNWQIQLIGQNAVIGGNIPSSPNGFAFITEPNNPRFTLSKYYPKIEFASPIQSVTQIIITGFNANGIAAQNLANINLTWFITFNVFYTFEGE
jgi:hypothetical protein